MPVSPTELEPAALVAAIDAHHAKTGLKPRTICVYAVNDSRLYPRLKSGGECYPRTARRLLAWLTKHDPATTTRTHGGGEG